MIIDCVSDLHGFYPKLEGGDLLIVAGDLTGNDYAYQYIDFYWWLTRMPYKKKILIAGNHDGALEGYALVSGTTDMDFDYLRDSGTEFEGLKIWGSPWTPRFGDWPFMLSRGAPLKAKWDLIPMDTDILITHGPPWSILDTTNTGKKCGCKDLLGAVAIIQPKLHIFGHIHGGYGELTVGPTRYVNCAIMDERYQPLNKPIRVIL